MSAITIHDLPYSRYMDARTMSAVRGKGAPWVFGWIRPFFPAQNSFGGEVNFFQVNNYYADQMINQFQVVNIDNTGSGSVISVGLDQQSANSKLPKGI